MFKRISSTEIKLIEYIMNASLKEVEMIIAELAREFLDDVSTDRDVWLLLSSVLSRKSIPKNSPLRISLVSILVFLTFDNVLHKSLVPVLDKFFLTSLNKGTPLIVDQTLDYIINDPLYIQIPKKRKQYEKLKNKIQELVKKEEFKFWQPELQYFIKDTNIVKEYDYNKQQLLVEYYNYYNTVLSWYELDNNIKTQLNQFVNYCASYV